MAKKTTVQITKDNIEQLDIKVGTILKDNEGIFWKITDISDFMPGMRVCDKDGKELKNFARNAKRTMIGGGLSDLLNDGITTYYIETEQPELKEEDVKNLKIVSDEISPSEIETERLLIQKKIQEIKNELENPDINYPDYKNEISDLKEYIERLEKVTDDEIKNQIIWKKENQRKNEENHKLVVEDMKKGREMRNSPKEGELLSYNQIHPIFTLTNKETGRKTSIQPTGRIEENIKRLGRLKNLTEAKNAIEKIKASGFDIYSTENRVVLFNKDKFYDFNDSGESNFNFQTEKFEFNIDNRNLKSWDFKSYIEGGLKITKRMKAFEKIENKTAIQENELNESVFANKEEAQAIYFNDLSTEQKEEVINGYRSADDPNMLTEWENLLRENFVQIQKDNSFISSVDIEKETSVFINPPTDEWISEYLQKNKVNFNTEFWQDIFAEIEPKPELKTYHKLKKEEIDGLKEITQEEFNSIIDALYQQPNPDYKEIPPVIKLPQINKEIAQKLGVENANFFMRSEIAHVRPQRKGNYDQALRIEEMKGMLDFIKTCKTAYIDNNEKHQNFMLAGLDEQDDKKSNKIVFNKDEYGNYIVTVGKVDTFNLEESKYSKVAVGVEPTIWMEIKSPSIATMLRSSTTSLNELNIAQKAEKSSKVAQLEHLTKHHLTEIRTKCREILKKSDSQITEDDKKILSQYEGAGGLNEENRSVNGILNEFYTPQNLVDKVWKIVDYYAPNAKTVLEPSAGVGKFANNRPQNEFTMHELDETSARINKILHPQANVIQGAYQKQFFDETERFRKTDFEQPKYDVVIGNPPYGKYNDKYKGLGEGKEFDRYEEYFISKGLDSLKDENSILAFVVPSGFLKSANDSQKKILAQKGKLIDAYRLPNKAFPTTEVGTDIIVMRKWNGITDEEKKSRIDVETKKISGDTWFKNHPEKVLGETKEITNRFGKPDFEVVLPDSVSLDDELRKIDGFVAESNYESALNKVSSGLEAYVNGKISKNELDELSKEHTEAAELLGKNVEKTQVKTLNLPENTVDLTDVFDGKLKNLQVAQKENSVERRNFDDDYEMSEKEFNNFSNNLKHKEENFLQGKDQEEDELASNWANEDFERTQRMNEIISEIKKTDFKMEVSIEDNLHKVVLTNKNGEEIFREQETGNTIVPITSNVAVWANDAESENLKKLADEYFNIISEDGVRGGEYVNNVFGKDEKLDLKTYHTLKEEDVIARKNQKKSIEQNVVNDIVNEVKQNIETSQSLGKIKLISEEEQLKDYGITAEAHAKYFVKSTAEFEQFADFEPITNLTGEEAVAKYKELQKKGVHCGIGINIDGDYVFDDKNGNGITVLVRNDEGKDTLNIYGDSFVKNLKESDQHSFDVLVAFDTLYRTAKSAGLDVEDSPYIAEKENELFENLFSQNQIYDGYASKQATNYVLEKLKVAGIEVVTDKDEFERRFDEINGTDVFQAMTEKFVETEKTRISDERKTVPRATAEIKSAIKDALEKTAVPLAEVVYSRENYQQIFRDGIVQSPVETIKLGANQFVRLCPPDRNNLMGAIYETMTKPALVLEKETFDEKSEKFKPVHVYGKSFINKKDDHTRAVESIVIFRNGENIAASLHNRDISKFIDQIKTADDIIYIDNEVSRVAAFSIKAGDSHVVKETQEFLSSSGLKSLPSWNKFYNPEDVLSIKKLIDDGKVQGGIVEINENNFDKYFNIFNQNLKYKDNRNKIASDLFNYHVKPENKAEMKEWLENQGYEIKEKPRQFKISNGNVYGFTDGEKIYLNPDFLNSNVAVHEYTHLWDEYTRRTNPELWQKGMNIFKGTKFFAEVKSDPNYADIANDDNLVLSEVHARICGKLAQKYLERIAMEDGEIKSIDVVEWNNEVAEYVKKELFPDREIFHQRYHTNGITEGQIDGDAIERFLTTPMTDLAKGLSVKKRDFKTRFENGDFTEVFERLSDINFKADIYKTMSKEEQEKEYEKLWNELFPDGEPSEIEAKRKEWKVRVLEHDKKFTSPETLASYKRQAKKAPAEKIEELLSRLKSNKYSFYPETQKEADTANERQFKSAILNRIANNHSSYYSHSLYWDDVYVPSDTIIASYAEKEAKMQVLEEELKVRGISKKNTNMENTERGIEGKSQKIVAEMKGEHAENQATNYVLEKLKVAGIEVVTNKDEFNRILKSADRLQKMTEDLSEYEKLFEKANKEKQKTESISSEKKSLEEEREVLERKNYEEFVDFVKSTEKYWSGDAVRLLNNDLCTADITDKYFNSISIAFDSKKSIMSAYYIKIDDYESLKKERLHYGFSFNDSSLLDSYKKNLKTYLEQKITIEQQKQNRMLSEIWQMETELAKNSSDSKSLASDFERLDKSLRFNSNFEIESSGLGENVSVFPGSTGKSGLGIRHIIEERFKKDNLSQDEITALCGLILETVRNGEITRDSKNRCEFSKNGIIAVVRKDFDNEEQNWILTGFHYTGENEQKNREATETIKTVIAKYSNSDGYSYFRSQVGAVIASLDSNISQNQDKSTIQKMVVSSEEPENIESLFVSKNEENLNSEIDKLTEKDINVWNDYINISSETPFIYKQFGLDNYPVNMYKQKLARALFVEKEKFGERRTHGHKGEFTSENVKDVFKDFGNPRYIFNSKHDLDNPDNFYLIGVYDELDEQGNPMMLSLHFDKNRKQVEANWVTSVYGKNKEVLLNDWVRKGYLVYKNDLEIEKASEEVVALYMRVSNLQKSSENNIKLKSDYVNDMDLLFAKQKENVYGFAHEGKIYLNPDFLNSNVAVHEYTHLWDEYTRRTNPELWQKGMNIFKDTKFFAEVKSDPNYADIANDDNLVLSEVHARICGEMAEKILERIVKEDGEITRDKAIDWNDEVFEYVYDEFGFGRNSAFAKENGKSNGYVWSDYADFLVTPLKDLMNGKNISLRQNTEQKVELQSKTIDHKSREQKKSEKLFINEYEKEEKQSMKNSNDILRSVEQLEIMEINILNENGWRSANDIVSSNDNARKYLEEIKNRTATNLKLGKEEFSILEGDNYHTLNDALGILGVYGKEYQKDVLKKLEKYPSTILLPPDVAKEFVNDLILKTNQITPVSLEEILSVMEMKSEVTSNGKIKIYDQQRQEYIDNRSPLSDSDEDNLSFDNPAEIFERLDTYINDYFIADMEEQLQASGVTLRGDETLKDLCDYAKEQLEAGITTVSQGELNLAMGIINPETVIMPEGFDENKIPFFEKENIPKTVLEQLPKSSSELTADDLKNAKALLPKAQYQVVLEYTQGEEGEHFKGIIKEISSKAEAIKGKKEIFTKDEKHPLAFKYMLGTSSFYFSEWDGADELFGYAILNGDTQMSEWGYTSLEELKNAGGKDRNGFPVMPEMIFYGLEDTIERQIAVDYPELSEKMGFAPKLNHNEELISEFGKEIFKTLQSHKLEQNSYNICCAAQFIIQTMDSSEKKEIFSIMEKCGCKGKNGKANTENFLTEVVKAENNTASSVYDRKRLYEKINKSCSSKKTEKNEVIHNTENDYNMEI